MATCAALLLGTGVLPAAPAPSPEPDVVRVFTLRYRKAEEAFLVVRPLLTSRGSLVLQPALNALTVRDAGRAVDQAARAVESFDVPPRAFAVSVALLRATNSPLPAAAPTPIAEQLRGV
ncbi:MAG TPA: secretin N-terminal domain-containing protein, partial [Thermoanaerobaculia bacterium]|nr:secretin N-terminal domain-containing protein [Thermoanaerobaculia bacterium]